MGHHHQDVGLMICFSTFFEFMSLQTKCVEVPSSPCSFDDFVCTDIDGVSCGWAGITSDTSNCYAVLPSTVVVAARILTGSPHPIDWLFRMLLTALPKSLMPKAESYAGVLVVNPESSSFVELLQDPSGIDISHLTGVTVHNNKLYFGSLTNNYVGVHDLA